MRKTCEVSYVHCSDVPDKNSVCTIFIVWARGGREGKRKDRFSFLSFLLLSPFCVLNGKGNGVFFASLPGTPLCYLQPSGIKYIFLL